MDLFIPNYNNCATIAAYQFIQCSNMTYKEFKKMVSVVSDNKYDMSVLEFIEPVIKKYWNEKDPYKFPENDKAAPFKGHNKDKNIKCKTCLVWNENDAFEDVDNEYMCFDFFGRLLLRIITTIDIESKPYHKSFKELWTKGYDPGPGYNPLIAYVLDKVRSERVTKYCEYMQKYTDHIPLIAYEIVFDSANKNYEYHIVCLIKVGDKKYIDLNSNLKLRNVREYNALIIRKTSGNWTKEPPRKIIHKILDLKDLENVGLDYPDAL